MLLHSLLTSVLVEVEELYFALLGVAVLLVNDLSTVVDAGHHGQVVALQLTQFFLDPLQTCRGIDLGVEGELLSQQGFVANHVAGLRTGLCEEGGGCLDALLSLHGRQLEQ